MNTALIVVSILGFIALTFGAWGRFSTAGRARFDEMAGIIPTAAFYLGIALLGLGFLLGVIAFFRR